MADVLPMHMLTKLGRHYPSGMNGAKKCAEAGHELSLAIIAVLQGEQFLSRGPKNWDIELTALKSQSALCGEREHVTSDLPPFSAHRIIRLALHRNGRWPLPFRGDTFGVTCTFSLSVHSNPHRCSMVGMEMACRSTRPLWTRCQMHSSGSAPKA